MPWLRSAAVAFLLVNACLLYVPARGSRGDPPLRGDSISYAAMVRGADTVEAPFRYRIAVPMLARAMPLSPERALAVISWSSLFVAYTLILELARRLGVGPIAAAAGLVAAVFSAPHLYNYENPYLTDAPGLLLVTACVHALLTRSYMLFLLACVLGVGVREAQVFLSPGWAATRRRGPATIAIALSLAAYVAIRALVGPLSSAEEGPFAGFPARAPEEALAEALAAWHGLWLLAPLGLARIAPPHRAALFWSGALLLGGAALASLLASDTMRMFQPLFPVIALGTGSFLEALWHRSRAAVVALLATVLAASSVWQPGRLLTLQAGSASYRHACAAACALLGLAALASVALLYRDRWWTRDLGPASR